MRDLSMYALRRRRQQLASPVEPPESTHVAEDDHPKAEAPERGRESDPNCPSAFDEMRINPKINLRAWVRENIVPWDKEHSSYFLKHRAEDAIGSYVSNGEMRGAMMDAGYLPVGFYGPNAFYRAGTRKDLDRHFALDTFFLLEGLQMWAYRIRRQLYLRSRGGLACRVATATPRKPSCAAASPSASPPGSGTCASTSTRG